MIYLAKLVYNLVLARVCGDYFFSDWVGNQFSYLGGTSHTLIF